MSKVEGPAGEIDVNVSALTHLTRGMLPWLRENGAGHVMNVGSVASFQPGPLMATYYASKAYVLSFSEALHNECRGSGVTVSCVCPGPTRTGFARVAGISPKAKVDVISYDSRGGDAVARQTVGAVRSALFPRMGDEPILPPELAILQDWRMLQDDPILAVLPYQLVVR